MLTEKQFTTLLGQVRVGDQEAASRLVKLYEPEIRRAARIRLTDPKLRRMVDSMDICQSVFGRFFQVATDASFALENSQQLLALLTTMIRNRVIDEHRRQSAAKRDWGSEANPVDVLDQLTDETAGPRTTAIAREMLATIRSRLSSEELLIADQRHAGMTWEQIAEKLHQSPEVIRKRLERALQRVREELHFAGSSTQ